MLKRLAVALLATALTFGVAQTAFAQNVQLRGTQELVSEADGHYLLRGDLYGDWYTTSFDVRGYHPSGTLQATGTETFVGCRDLDRNSRCDTGEPAGWLDFTFMYSSSASGNGRCHHPVVASGGDFAGATGQLNFKDRLGSCGAVYTTYTGHLKY